MKMLDVRLLMGSVVGLGLIALLGWVTGVELWLGRLLYDPASAWAMNVRNISVLAMQAGLLGCLAVVAWPFSHTRHALLVRTCGVMLLTAIFGAGLLNQTIIKETVERPRPRESGVLVMDVAAPNLDGFRGNSMPSGHAGFALLLAVPFVTLRRDKPALAQGFLLAGSVAAAVIGVSRMVLGAHYLSDVLVACAITLGSAILLDALLRRYGTPRPLLWVSVTVLTAMAMIAFNHFTMTYSMLLPHDFRRLDLPCEITAVDSAEVSAPLLTLDVDAYGAPKSLLSVVNDGGVIRLDHGLGFFHTLTCSGTLQRPVSD